MVLDVSGVETVAELKNCFSVLPGIDHPVEYSERDKDQKSNQNCIHYSLSLLTTSLLLTVSSLPTIHHARIHIVVEFKPVRSFRSSRFSEDARIGQAQLLQRVLHGPYAFIHVGREASQLISHLRSLLRY